MQVFVKYGLRHAFGNTMQFLFSITWGNVSGWWLPVCVLAGLLYAWLLYKQPVALKASYRYLLFGFRTIVIALTALLLIAPLVRSVTYNPQKPLVLVLQDNSESVKLYNKVSPTGGDLEGATSGLPSLKKQLGDKYEVREFHFSDSLQNGLSTSFNGRQTNISRSLHEVNERFVNQNIGAIILATDGIYNQGSDPLYEAKKTTSAIYTIALGDTVPKRDLLISNLNYNRTAFLGNDFEAEILVEAYQAKGEIMHLTVSYDGRQVYAQNIPVTGNSFHKVITAKLTASVKGLQRYNISIAPVANELSVKNNAEPLLINVIDARRKVLLIFDAPHPDIGAIRNFIEANKSYEVKTVQLADMASVKPADYSLVMLYQLPGAATSAVQSVLKSKIPVWFFAGAQTDLQSLNSDQALVKVNAVRPDMQEVFAQPVNGFSAFTLSDSSARKIAALPPLLAPFGDYRTAGDAAILFKQRIGSVNTAYPLLLFGTGNGKREAVLTGEGVWRWQLSEFETYQNHNAMDELFGQSVQYLTANAGKTRFNVYTNKRVFDEGEHVLLNAELYNDALDLINTPDVKIELKNTGGKNFSYLFSKAGNSYSLDAGSLPVGDYTFTANTKLGTQSFIATGQLIVKPLNLELQQSAANHQLLREIAAGSGGRMLYPSQINLLAGLIRKNDNIKTVVYEDRHYTDLIDLKWVFFLVAGLLSLEWLLRKREGEI